MRDTKRRIFDENIHDIRYKKLDSSTVDYIDFIRGLEASSIIPRETSVEWIDEEFRDLVPRREGTNPVSASFVEDVYRILAKGDRKIFIYISENDGSYRARFEKN